MKYVFYLKSYVIVSLGIGSGVRCRGCKLNEINKINLKFLKFKFQITRVCRLWVRKLGSTSNGDQNGEDENLKFNDTLS